MTAMEHQTTGLGRIVRRVADVVAEMNYSQRRAMELFLGLEGHRR